MGEGRGGEEEEHRSPHLAGAVAADLEHGPGSSLARARPRPRSRTKDARLFSILSMLRQSCCWGAATEALPRRGARRAPLRIILR